MFGKDICHKLFRLFIYFDMKNQLEAGYKTKSIEYLTFGTVVLGMVAGSLFYLSDMAFMNTGMFRNGIESYSIGAVMNLPVLQVAFYILRKRIGQLLFFVVMGVLLSYGIAAGVYGFLSGLFYGMVFSNVILQYGIKGIGYGAACFFPHYVFYLLAVYFCVRWINVRSSTAEGYMYKVNKSQYFIKFFVICGLIILALIWEIKIQKFFLNFFYQYLV